jgi:hypothetical protein
MGHYDDEPDWYIKERQLSSCRVKRTNALYKEAHKLAMGTKVGDRFSKSTKKTNELDKRIKKEFKVQMKLAEAVDKETQKFYDILLKRKYGSEEELEKLVAQDRKKIWPNSRID